MQFFIIYDKVSGKVLRTGSAQEHVAPEDMLSDAVRAELGPNAELKVMTTDEATAKFTQAPWLYKHVNGDFELDEQETLADAQRSQLLAIDAKTNDLVVAGFSHRGMQFASSTEALVRALGMAQFSDDMTYPIQWEAIDGTVLTLKNAKELHDFALAFVNFQRGVSDGSITLKGRVRGARNAAEAMSIKDKR